MRRLFLGGWAYAPGTIAAAWPEVTVVGAADPLPPVGRVPVVIGWSLGGLRALAALAEGRLQADRLVLIATTARFCATDGYACGQPRSALRAMMVGMKRNRAATLGQFFALSAAPRDLGGAEQQQQVEASASLDDAALAQGLEQLDRLDLRHELAGIRTPTLILHGAADRVIPVQAGEFLAAAMPAATLVVHPDPLAGHDLPLREAAWIREHADLRGE